jgi:hypothetical protein
MGYGIPFRGAFSAYISKEALMRIPALAILTIATVLTAAPVRAQTYDPAYPVCLHVYQWGGPTITIAATRRCLSATRRHRAAPPRASSIHILLAWKSPARVIGIAASTKSVRQSNAIAYLVVVACLGAAVPGPHFLCRNDSEFRA